MDIKPLSFGATLAQYENQAKDLVKAYRSGDADVKRRIRQHHPRLRGRANTNDRNDVTDSEVRSARVALADAQCIVARCHGFESWPRLAKHVAALTRKNSRVLQFESAVEAIITGDVAILKSLLGENPALVRARSTREHHATLLHYVAANGVEGFRQKTPKNAVQIAEILLKAGAEVDAELAYSSAMRRRYPERSGSRTLGMVATSVHPARAGVQIALLETLMDAGAAIDGAPGGWNPLLAALHNGRPEAAEFLASRGARMGLEGAAGVGRLDLVKSFFKKDGSLKATATKAQMEDAFILACLYGRTSIAKFLLEKGVDPAAGANVGQTGFHCAALGGHLDTVKMLLQRKAPLELLNAFGGTVLGQATWCVINGDPTIDYFPIIKILLDADAKVEEVDYPTGNKRIDEMLRRHGA
ncbi:MAG TPA: ankyrin repeat domain-containing protein [Gemmataceae bacterium]|jgi:ankyrin repeat protein|nr:ankyrin repeat domain-containing protein [Gemmataceae bacterium]